MKTNHLSQIDINHFYDIVYELMDKRKITDTLLSDESLLKLYNLLPDRIKSIGDEWGFGDTVFRDLAYEWMDEQNILITKP
jgi:hypothetical protein